MILTYGELRSKFSGVTVKYLDREYQCFSDSFLKKVIAEYDDRCKWRPRNRSWFARFKKDMRYWSRKNDCDNHAFRFFGTARDEHCWSDHRTEGIAVGVVFVPGHCLNVVIMNDGKIRYFDQGLPVGEPKEIRWMIF